MAEELTHLTIDEIENGIDDLLGKRADALAKLSAGASFKTLFARKREELRAIPKALRGLPRAEMLRVLDLTHDRHLRALDLFRRFLQVWPNSTPALAQAAALLVEEFVTGSGETQAPYAVEAQRAADRAGKIATHKAVLDGVMMPDGSPLTAAVQSYTSAGAELGATHSGRADDLAGRGDASRAGAIRGEVIGLFADLRTAIRRDLQANPGLSATLEADVLGFVDELQRLARARGDEAPKSKPDEMPPT